VQKKHFVIDLKNKDSKLLILKTEDIGPGFSGAPLLNYSGEIIGMIIGGNVNLCEGIALISF
jgi:V8-like Glu-specific endopeptidase